MQVLHLTPYTPNTTSVLQPTKQIQTKKRTSVDKTRKKSTVTACNFCKKRHIKCDGEKPCNQCSNRKLTCSYGKLEEVPSEKEVFWESKFKDSQKEIEELKLALMKANQYLPTNMAYVSPNSNVNYITLDYASIYIKKFAETVLPLFNAVKMQDVNPKYLETVLVGDNLDELCEAFESSIVLAHGACTVRSTLHSQQLCQQALKYYTQISEIVGDPEKTRLLCTEKHPQKIIDSTLLLQYLVGWEQTTDCVAKKMGLTTYKLFESNYDKIPGPTKKRLFASLGSHAFQESSQENSHLLAIDNLNNFFAYGDEGPLIEDALLTAGFYATSMLLHPEYHFGEPHFTLLEILEKAETKLNYLPELTIPRDYIYFTMYVIRSFLYHKLGKSETGEYWITKALMYTPLEYMITEKRNLSNFSNVFFLSTFSRFTLFGTPTILLMALTVIRDTQVWLSLKEKIEKYLLGMFPKVDKMYEAFKNIVPKHSLLSESASINNSCGSASETSEVNSPLQELPDSFDSTLQHRNSPIKETPDIPSVPVSSPIQLNTINIEQTVNNNIVSTPKTDTFGNLEISLELAEEPLDYLDQSSPSNWSTEITLDLFSPNSETNIF